VNVAVHSRVDRPVGVLMSLFASGIDAAGDHVTVTMGESPQNCDAAVVWGVNQRALRGAYERRGTPVLVMERGFVGDRLHWTSLGWDGLNGRATWAPTPCPPDRWYRDHAGLMQPWRGPSDGDVLVVGQVPRDNSLEGADVMGWCQRVAAAVPAGRGVRYRPHPSPRAPQYSPIPGVMVDRGELATSLRDVGYVVTYSSNTAVESVLAGVPTMTVSPMSMAYDVTAHDLDALWSADEPPRQAWAHWIAYCQWTPDELSNGTAWSETRQRIEVTV